MPKRSIIFLLSSLALTTINLKAAELIEEVATLEAYEDLLNNSDRAVAVLYYNDHCEACTQAKPMYEDLAKKYSKVKVVKVNTDKVPQLVKRHAIAGVPAMHIHEPKKLEPTHKIEGARPNLLDTLLDAAAKGGAQPRIVKAEPQQEQPMPDQEAAPTPAPAPAPKAPARRAAGEVVHVKNAQHLENLIKSGRPVVVKFSAEWCGACKMVAPHVKDLATKHPNVTIAEVDVDQNKELAAKYKVFAMPTFLVFEAGKTESTQNIVGAQKEKLTDLVNSLSQKAAPAEMPVKKVKKVKQDANGQPKAKRARAVKTAACPNN